MFPLTGGESCSTLFALTGGVGSSKILPLAAGISCLGAFPLTGGDPWSALFPFAGEEGRCGGWLPLEEGVRDDVLLPMPERPGLLPVRDLLEPGASNESTTLKPTALATERIWRSGLLMETSLPCCFAVPCNKRQLTWLRSCVCGGTTSTICLLGIFFKRSRTLVTSSSGLR